LQATLCSAWLCAMKAEIPHGSQPKHETLVKALTCRDASAAVEAMRAHVKVDREDTLRTLEPCFEVNKKSMLTYSRTIRQIPERVAHSPAA
jgi:DNA-binding GntR family transcriptional regulator